MQNRPSQATRSERTSERMRRAQRPKGISTAEAKSTAANAYANPGDVNAGRTRKPM